MRCVVMASLLAGCARTATPTITPTAVFLRIAADPVTLPLMQALTQAYGQRASNVNFTLLPIGAAADAGAALGGQVSLAAVSQPVGATWSSDLALDGVVVIVNPVNGLSEISSLTLRQIYAGAISAWDGVAPGLSGDIQVAVRDDADTGRRLFDRAIMGDLKLTPGAVVLPSPEVMMNFVAYQPNAIGYVTSSRITPAVKPLRIDGAAPTARSIADGTYPMARMLSLVAAAEPAGALRDFVAWALSDDGQRVVIAANYVSILQAPQ